MMDGLYWCECCQCRDAFTSFNKRDGLCGTCRRENRRATRIVPDDQAWREMRRCVHPQHDAPTMILIPPGHMVIHTCPGCGLSVTIRPTIATLSAADQQWLSEGGDLE